jgi:hypothetical protein
VTPTTRTLRLLRQAGMLAEVVERWNSFSRTRRDLFGFLDVLALAPEEGVTWGIQCTSADNLPARLRKITLECSAMAAAWLQCGNRIEVIGWSKRGPRGGRKRWTAARREVTLEDLARIIQTPRGKAAAQEHPALFSSRSVSLGRPRGHTAPLPPAGEVTPTSCSTG